MQEANPEAVKRAVRGTYAQVARKGGGCGCGSDEAGRTARVLGYSGQDLRDAPQGANLGLGCGNPTALAGLKAGETVVDLGSGAGFDCFLAARRVGPRGRVIGVDMTPEMIDRARANAERMGSGNVEFRLGEIESLPLDDASADVILSNCVVNLSPDKPAAYREAFRVLRPGGRLAISDIVATAPLPEEVRTDLATWAGCVAGAALVDDLRRTLEAVGFRDIRITPRAGSREVIREMAPSERIADYVVSADIEARKP